MKVAKQSLSYTNAQERSMLLIVEPWAEHYWIKPKMKVEIVGVGGESGGFELVQSAEELIVYGWIDSIVTVMHEGIEIAPSAQD